MGRNSEKNITEHNSKLHKKKEKAKKAASSRQEKLKAIVKKSNDSI